MQPQSHFLGMPRNMSYMEPSRNYTYIDTSPVPPLATSHDIDPRYLNPHQFNHMVNMILQSQMTYDLPMRVWWNEYVKAFYILAVTYDSTEPMAAKATKIFFESVFALLPNSKYRKYCYDFMNMDPYVVSMLKSSVPNIFNMYSWLESFLVKEPKNFVTASFSNQDSQALFLWVYLLDVFIQVLSGKEAPDYQHQRVLYNIQNINKQTWGNAMWFIIHTSAMFAPQPVYQSFVHFKNMMASLQYILPCPVCKKHLQENLAFIDFDRAPKNCMGLYQCTWQLHDRVNKAERKQYQPSLEQAIYDTCEKTLKK